MASIAQLSRSEQEQLVRPLLDHLVVEGCHIPGQWNDWQIASVPGGQNNLLYRATSATGDLAVKFVIRDGRDRAGREYGALTALSACGLSIAPVPILLDQTTYPQPVVVQTWLAGEVHATPPTTDVEWQRLVDHFACLQTVTPARSQAQLRPAALNVIQAVDGKQIVSEQVAHIPVEDRPPSLRALLDKFEAAQFPIWPEPDLALCRVDNNTLNFIRRSEDWASVDWENSGWGDPAFDIADVLTHAAFMTAPPSRWPWLMEAYCVATRDAAARIRIETYQKILAVWWVARLARYLYEIPRGLDNRLVAWSDGWQPDHLMRKYQHYLDLAETLGF